MMSQSGNRVAVRNALTLRLHRAAWAPSPASLGGGSGPNYYPDFTLYDPYYMSKIDVDVDIGFCPFGLHLGFLLGISFGPRGALFDLSWSRNRLGTVLRSKK